MSQLLDWEYILGEAALNEKVDALKDMVNHPAHYNKQGIEVIDVIEAYSLGNYHLGNVIKYCCRSGFKGTMLEDWKKARWYLDRLIALEESYDRTDPVPDLPPVEGDS